MKTKEELKKIMLYARKKGEEINRDNPLNHCYFSIAVGLETIEGFVLDVNPYRFDLRTGKYYGRDLLDGELKVGTYW